MRLETNLDRRFARSAPCGEAAMSSSRENTGEPLPAHLERRFEGYLKDEALMARMRALVPMSTALYAFAKKRYHEQWERPLGTC